LRRGSDIPIGIIAGTREGLLRAVATQVPKGFGRCLPHVAVTVLEHRDEKICRHAPAFDCRRSEVILGRKPGYRIRREFTKVDQ
jgi:hypothetical protein